MTFAFDKDLIGTQVYQNAVRSLFRRFPRRNKTGAPDSRGLPGLSEFRIPAIENAEEKTAAKQSQKIDGDIAKERWRLRETLEILVTGSLDSGVHDLSWDIYKFDERINKIRDQLLGIAVQRFQEVFAQYENILRSDMEHLTTTT